MDKAIQDILNLKCKKEIKYRALDALENEIKIAKEIISGKYKYCPDCDDYYLAKSFLSDNETKSERICVYEDPINSGSNDYVDGYVDITYSVCPKGHKHEVDRKERLKYEII